MACVAPLSLLPPPCPTQDVVDDAIERDYVEPNELIQFTIQVRTDAAFLAFTSDCGV